MRIHSSRTVLFCSPLFRARARHRRFSQCAASSSSSCSPKRRRASTNSSTSCSRPHISVRSHNPRVHYRLLNCTRTLHISTTLLNESRVYCTMYMYEYSVYSYSYSCRNAARVARGGAAARLAADAESRSARPHAPPPAAAAAAGDQPAVQLPARRHPLPPSAHDARLVERAAACVLLAHTHILFTYVTYDTSTFVLCIINYVQ